MPIDWFTVTAQALNFIVLVWLLKRFLYGPILRAIDAREHRVAAELADAAAKQAQALRERDDFARRNADFDRQREAQLAQLHTQVTQERQHLLERARADAAAWSARRLSSLHDEATQQGQAIRAQVQQEVFAIARKTLQDLASQALEDRVCALFAERLRHLDAAQRKTLASTLGASDAPLQVRSAFVLEQPQREVLEAALRETLGQDVPLQYSCSEVLVGGIELLGGGHKIGWNIGDYLDVMEHNVAQRLQQLTEPGPDAATAASGKPAAGETPAAAPLADLAALDDADPAAPQDAASAATRTSR
ncbi:F0F1 ATP synthase subunit B [Comamonadaceae bacterium G21597-S1]|nr:F0F1 ATP synthase subunit B [Comamonadaceae bacterium G21597-S1]